jgi:two-component system chemotaxis response regulator CheY
MTGIDMLRAIRKDASLSELPVIMLTARNEKEYIQEALDAGVSGYIVKPFTQEALTDRLQKIFKSAPLCRPE